MLFRSTQMVGRSVETVVAKQGANHGKCVLELQNVRLLDKAQNTVSLTVHAGEIVGIAGVDGNGQQELEAMITGNPDRTNAAIRNYPSDPAFCWKTRKRAGSTWQIGRLELYC